MATEEEQVDLKQYAKENRFALWFALLGLVLGWFYWWTFNGDCSWLDTSKRVACDLGDAAISYFGVPMIAPMLSFFGALAFLGSRIDALLARDRRNRDRAQMDNLLKEFVQQQGEFARQQMESMQEQRKFNGHLLEVLIGIQVAIERTNRPPADP